MAQNRASSVAFSDSFLFGIYALSAFAVVAIREGQKLSRDIAVYAGIPMYRWACVNRSKRE